MEFVLIFLLCLYFPSRIHTNEQASITALNIIENANHSHRIHIGAKTFKELLQRNEVFIDKTLLIKEFINSHEKAIALTRPGKWGKSVNLHMIKDFVEIPLNTYGQVLNKNSTWAYKLFQRGEVAFDNGDVKKLKNPLLISRDEEFMKRFQGEYPVIYLTFKNLRWNGDAEEVRKGIEMMLSEIFIEHHYLLLLLQYDLEEYDDDEQKFSEKIRTTNDIKAFKRILYCLPVSAIELAQSVHLICRLLFHCFHKYVYVFIDDYDSPVADILKQRYFTTEEKNYLSFFQSFLDQIFQKNEFITKGIVTGVLPIASRSYTSHGSIHGSLVDFYGFLDTDVTGLLEHFNHPTDQAKQLMDWYSGYRTDKNKNDSFFNPWSIMQFFNTNKIDNHWIQCDNSKYIGEVIQHFSSIRHVMQRLIQKEKLSIQILEKKGFTEQSIKVLQVLTNPPFHFQANETTVNVFLTFLMAKGYVTVVPGTLRYYQMEMQLPNQEITKYFREHFLAYYKFSYDFLNNTLEPTASLMYGFMANDKSMCEILKNSLAQLWNFTSLGNVQVKNFTVDVSRINAEFVNSIIDALVMQIAVQHEPNDVEMVNNGKTDKNIMLYLKRLHRGVVINFGYNEASAIEIFNQAKKQEHVFDQFEPSSLKFIGINVASNKTVAIVAEISELSKKS